jgi:thioredoxin reductase
VASGIAATSWDVVIVGAGPAGLSAALILGRCCRRVLLCDRGTPRSWASKSMHAFITRDGVPPEEFSRLARRELTRYRNITYWRGEVTEAARLNAGFVVRLGRRRVRTRKLLIATGLLDELPQIEGFAQLFGISVFQCPYCDGWELRDQAVAAYGKRKRGYEMARALTGWTRDVVLCTDGPSGLNAAQRRQLRANGITVRNERILRLEMRNGRLSDIVFQSGQRLPRRAIFFDMPSRPQSPLAYRLGCLIDHRGAVRRGQHEATSVPGVFVAGNIIRDVQLSIVAAAEGARAAFGINHALTREDFERRARGKARVRHPASSS